jgi:hypothetical protein
VAATVDAILRSATVRPEIRRRLESGEIEINKPDEGRRDPTIHHSSSRPGGRNDRDQQRNTVVNFPSPSERNNRPAIDEPIAPIEQPAAPVELAPVAPMLPKGRGTSQKPLRIYPFGVSRNRLESAVSQLRLPAVIVRDPREADMVMTLKSYYRQKPQPIRDAEARGTSVYVLRSNTSIQMEHVLSSLFPNAARRNGEQMASDDVDPDSEAIAGAMLEAEEAITNVMAGAPPVMLTPQETHIRKLQHALAERYNIGSRSTGREPNRRVEIFREGF